MRDALLGLPDADRDWVVDGATPQEMTPAGYKPVGRDFPVFLHPETHEEYALARTERKSGRGYKGFTVYCAPDVTLEDDLRRRDLTINAIARAEDGSLIDPFGGRKDLEARLLRHVSEAFAEDPVRILRVARFSARFDFGIAPETMQLMKGMVASGETDHLVPERVWQEFARGLMEKLPRRMFEALEHSGLLGKVFPEIKRWPQQFDGPLPARFALLCWDFAQADIEALCSRLRVPNDERELALLACRTQKFLAAQKPDELLLLFKRSDAFRRPERFALLLQAAALAQPGFKAERIEKALAAASAVDAGEIAARASAPAGISALLDQAREQAIADVL